MKVLIAVIALFGFLSTGYAEETIAEKTAVEVKTIKRSAKKGVNRTKEALCGKLTGDSKLECLAKKAKHRVEEGAAVVTDKASEVKGAVDTDKK